MEYWVSTDWHFDHANIMLPSYESRPLGFEQMLIDRHNEVMADDDILICLGDVIFGMNKEGLNDYLTQFENYIGKIILCKGNHDTKPNSWYSHKGFDLVCDSITINGVMFSHTPQMLGSDTVLNVHGHYHSNRHRTAQGYWYPADPRHILLSVENTDYYPINLKELKNGRYTANNTVYYSKGCKDGLESYNKLYSKEGCSVSTTRES